MSAAGGSAPADDLAPLSDRLAVLQVVRVLIVTTVVAASALEPDGSSPLAVLVSASVPYLLLTALVEWARHRARTRSLPLVQAMVLVDVVYLGAVLIATGGPQSALGFLAYCHVIAVTLLVSYRTGLRVAVAHSLLLFAGYVARVSGVVAAPAWLAGAGAPDDLRRAALFGSVGFWFVAMATAGLSSLNERELRRSKRELRGLARMGSALESAHTADEILTTLLAAVQEGFGGVRSAAARSVDGGVRVLGGPGCPPVVVDGRRPDGVMLRAWNGVGPVLVQALDPDHDPLFDSAIPWAGNVVVVPLVADGRHLGAVAIEVGGRRTGVPGRLVAMLGQYASHAALALRNAALLEEVRRLATVDGLTGLTNRRALEQALDAEVARAARSGEPLSVVLLDVDHFKAVNDHHGHQVGDDVLRAVGLALATATRGTDVAGRYGGEEFCVVLPRCRGREARLIAERLRAAVAAGGGPVAVTASAGVASMPANAACARELLQAADEALYQAKEAGRDRTARSRRRFDRLVA